jgi:hypothetical protein
MSSNLYCGWCVAYVGGASVSLQLLNIRFKTGQILLNVSVAMKHTNDQNSLSHLFPIILNNVNFVLNPFVDLSSH